MLKTGDSLSRLEIDRSKVKVSHIFGTGKPTNFKLGVWMEYDAWW